MAKKPKLVNLTHQKPGPPTCARCGSFMRIRLKPPQADGNKELVVYVCQCGAELERSEWRRPDMDFS